MRQISYLTILLGLCCTTLMACGSNKSNKDNNTAQVTTQETEVKSSTPTEDKATAKRYKYRIVAEYPHSTESYTQGLEYYDGQMWEGTGQYDGESHLMRTDITTGERHIVASLSSDEFGEGITHYKDRIYQLTWLEKRVYVYDLEGNPIDTIPLNGEGWGITTDKERLFITNGSSNIIIVDPETMEYKEVIHVTFNGKPYDNLNELEWIDGKIWANVYLSNRIVVINPDTGVIEGYLDLDALKQTQYNNNKADVLNGIAYDASTGHVYVTGKWWNKLFELEITE